jgi:S1-C subfamily serine protease
MRWVLKLAAAVLAAVMVPSAVAEDAAQMAVVRVTSTLRKPDVRRPWMKVQAEEISGSGVVIAGRRILTNAHVVLYARQIEVQPFQSSEKLPATVEAIGPGIDLAILKLKDESFFDTHPSLEISAELPQMQDAVAVYGYPTGGNDLSITKGIVSRIGYDWYEYLTEGLRIQVDAAINPGNSGGPALSNGKMIGLAFSRLDGSDNIGYIIPAEEIHLFLKDIADGHYNGKPKFLDGYQTIVNEALRGKLGLTKEVTGVLIDEIAVADDGYPLRVGDILTKIGDYRIDNSGNVRVEGNRLLSFRYLVQRLARDNQVELTVLHGGKERVVRVPVGPERDKLLMPYLMGSYPSYFVLGPLVFSEATDEFTDMAYYPGAPALMSRANPLITRYGDRPAFAGERLVVVAHPMFSHRIARDYDDPFMQVIKTVNGVKVRNLKHLVETVRDSQEKYLEITFHGRHVETLVFDREEAIQATEEVLLDNGIRRPCSEDIAAVWGGK